MASKSLVCPKCSGEMAEGFFADRGRGGSHPQEWVPGAPEHFPSFTFLGVQVHQVGVQLAGRARCKVVTYGCLQCGFLESYALAEAQVAESQAAIPANQ